MIVLMAGLPGTGKTTLARALTERTNGRLLSKDEFRHSIFLPGEIEYSSRQDDFCLQLMIETAGYLLSRDPTKIVLLDGRPFSRRYQIENAITTCESLQQPWQILECVCTEETARRRLEGDVSSANHPAGNRDFQLYLKVKERFEEILHAKTVIDTDRSPEACMAQVLNAFTN